MSLQCLCSDICMKNPFRNVVEKNEPFLKLFTFSIACIKLALFRLACCGRTCPRLSSNMSLHLHHFIVCFSVLAIACSSPVEAPMTDHTAR